MLRAGGGTEGKKQKVREGKESQADSLLGAEPDRW